MDKVFSYALSHVTIPTGRTLLLYGGPRSMTGDAYHPWQDETERLKQKGSAVFSQIDSLGLNYDAVFIHAPKQRAETEGLIALALARSKGFVMAAAANIAGGERLQSMMEAYGIVVNSASKNRCHAVWTTQAQNADPVAIKRNLHNLAFRQVEMEGQKWWSVPGLFGWDKIDPGSKLLLQHLPLNLAGRIADFGCGYGYLTTNLAHRYPAIKSIDAFDIDARAVTCCQRNGTEKVTAVWQDIRTLSARAQYDAVVMNPPFHQGKEEDLALGIQFIEQARRSLAPGGQFFLVANRHLPYERAVPGIITLGEENGYKVMIGGAS